jgi:hypothetical protein
VIEQVTSDSMVLVDWAPCQDCGAQLKYVRDLGWREPSEDAPLVGKRHECVVEQAA